MVVGPAGSVDDANELLDSVAMPSIAVLDVNPGGGQVYPIADRPAENHVPLLFTSRHDRIEDEGRYPREPALHQALSSCTDLRRT